MALTFGQAPALGLLAPSFALSDGLGQRAALSDFDQSPVLVVMFLCNHCPYVLAVLDRIVALAKNYGPRGVAFVAINANDVERYPADSPENMVRLARERGFDFPYLFDASQDVARAYGAVCTPDFFVYDHERRLAYRGRLDDNWKEPHKVTQRELAQALEDLLGGTSPATAQQPAMGCSIKWKY